MKTMELNPMTVAEFDMTATATKVNSIKKAVKKFFKATFRILVVISPVYPQYVESLKNKS